MKRTTYIFIGVFFANILILLGVIVYIKSFSQHFERPECRFDSSQLQRDSIDLNDVHTIEFSTRSDSLDRPFYQELGLVEITSSIEKTQSTMYYPVSDCLKLSKNDGVLSVILEFPSENPTSIDGQRVGVSLNGLVFNIHANRELNRVCGDLAFAFSLRKLRLDQLSLSANEVLVDTCAIGSLKIDAAGFFSGNNSQFDELHIDLDHVRTWRIDNDTIHSLYLTGSNRHHVNLSETQYHRLLWEPKNDNANLQVNVNAHKKFEIVVNGGD